MPVSAGETTVIVSPTITTAEFSSRPIPRCVGNIAQCRRPTAREGSTAKIHNPGEVLWRSVVTDESVHPSKAKTTTVVEAVAPKEANSDEESDELVE
jgi:hypothetical protein